jgi:hypothetical protein
VYVVGGDGTAAMKPVVVAFTTGDKSILDKGLDGGELVVTEGANQLRPGGKVTTAKPAASAPPARGSAAGPTASNAPAKP